MKPFVRTFVLALAAFVGACASVREASPELDQAAKSFTAPSGMAGVYVYRNETFGAAIKLDVFLDGKWLGETASKTYFYVEVPPGKHTVMGKGENQSVIDFDAVAGKLYYIWQEVKMGLFQPRNNVQLVDEETGRAGVMESKRVATQ